MKGEERTTALRALTDHPVRRNEKNLSINHLYVIDKSIIGWFETAGLLPASHQ